MDNLNTAAKSLVKNLFHTLGLEVTRYRPAAFGLDPFRDMRRLVGDEPRAVVFDVGANVGQSVGKFKGIMPGCEVHSFEPSPATYRLLARNVSRYRDVYLHNVGVGGSCGELALLENSYPDMSSFLKPSEFCWGDIVGETRVEVTTLDRYCQERGVTHVNVLKTDTQGFDLEVLKGAESLLRGNRVQMVYTEIIFSNMYQGLPAFDEVYRFLLDRNFALVSFYQFAHQKNMASWSDALFINHRFGARPGRA